MQLAERVGALSGLLAKERDLRIGEREDVDRTFKELSAKFELCLQDCKLSARLEELVRAASKDAAQDSKLADQSMMPPPGSTYRHLSGPDTSSTLRQKFLGNSSAPHTTKTTATYPILRHVSTGERGSSPPRSPPRERTPSAERRAFSRHSEYRHTERNPSAERVPRMIEGIEKIRLAERQPSSTILTASASLRSLPGHSSLQGSLVSESRWGSLAAPLRSFMQMPDTTTVTERPQMVNATMYVAPVGSGRAASPPPRAMQSPSAFPSAGMVLPPAMKCQPAGSRMSF